MWDDFQFQKKCNITLNTRYNWYKLFSVRQQITQISSKISKQSCHFYCVGPTWWTWRQESSIWETCVGRSTFCKKEEKTSAKLKGRPQGIPQTGQTKKNSQKKTARKGHGFWQPGQLPMSLLPVLGYDFHSQQFYNIFVNSFPARHQSRKANHSLHLKTPYPNQILRQPICAWNREIATTGEYHCFPPTITNQASLNSACFLIGRPNLLTFQFITARDLSNCM